MSGFRIPAATYRIQFSRNFRFGEARDLVPYLHELGITDVYASPRFKARKGSSHGYDVADPQRINSELGTDQEFEELVEKLKHYGMGLLLDIVPNHMAASRENPWWMDVLENGPSSAYANYFDIDWHPATTKAAFLQEKKVLLPVLGDLYGNVLENQELVLKLDENGFYVRYQDYRFPLDPKSYRPLLAHLFESLHAATGVEATARAEIPSLLEAIDRLPAFTAEFPAEHEQRRRQGKAIKEGIWRLYQSDPVIHTSLDNVLREFSGTREDPKSFDRLDRLLAVQPYRLAYWKIGYEEINYRRFFDINDLVGVRVEDPKVFEDRHRGILELVRDGRVTGIRVDHVDGLYDPRGYLEKLQQSAGGDTEAEASKNIYLIVEKILGERESLPEDWPVCGTTGYDFLNTVNALFIDPLGFQGVEEVYSRFTGSRVAFAEVCYASNKKVISQLLAGEVHALSHHLGKLAAQNRRARDLPLFELVQLLTEVAACLPVYRTYIRSFDIPARDAVFIEKALQMARSRATVGRLSDAALAFLHRVLLLDPPFYDEEQRAKFLKFVMRWQQFTGPAMAKGLEDTAYYIHNTLVSLNEVGGDPLRESLPFDVEAFHLFNQERQAKWPGTLNATSTHDTKRSEDVRARINVLSELAEEWEACLTRWSRWNQARKQTVEGHTTPAPHEEVLLYQTMLGAWPLEEGEGPAFLERLKSYMVKAAREAKIHTDWLSPSQEHEAALTDFVEAILDTSQKNRFLIDFLRFQKKIAFYGALNSLAQVLLKIASPGVPDFYQGTELWDFSLVDPDNRRPVDFAKRARLLEELKAEEAKASASLARSLLERWPDGRIKLYLTWKALGYRRANPELFSRGEYFSLPATSQRNENVCAFVRRVGEKWAIVAVPRLVTRLVDPGTFPLGGTPWGSSMLVLPKDAPPRWTNVVSGGSLRVSSAKQKKVLLLRHVFSAAPVALLAAVPE